MRINFDEISYGGPRKTYCRICRRKLTRVVRESMTISPFNKNPDGSVRSREEVSQAVLAKLKESEIALMLNGVVCSKCEPEEDTHGK